MARLSVFTLPLGKHIDPAGVRGYYIDLSEKAAGPEWPPPWFPFPGFHRYIAVGQWGVGAFERHLDEPADAWLEAIAAGARHLVETQRDDGLWLEPEPYPHTFRMEGPWPSAMAQGLCASFLVRASRALGDEEMADAARRALASFRVSTADGGVGATLDGAVFVEEYPTLPASYVLNGALYAVFGVHDVWRGLEDTGAGTLFEELTAGIVTNLHRWDMGYWSRYDLYPHPLINVASRSYHALHVNQLRVLHLLSPRPVLAETADRWEGYAAGRARPLRAFVAKGAFRLVVPRNHAIARRLPWADAPHRSFVR